MREVPLVKHYRKGVQFNGEVKIYLGHIDPRSPDEDKRVFKKGVDLNCGLMLNPDY